jgi:hypothetical protein
MNAPVNNNVTRGNDLRTGAPDPNQNAVLFAQATQNAAPPLPASNIVVSDAPGEFSGIEKPDHLSDKVWNTIIQYSNQLLRDFEELEPNTAQKKIELYSKYQSWLLKYHDSLNPSDKKDLLLSLYKLNKVNDRLVNVLLNVPNSARGNELKSQMRELGEQGLATRQYEKIESTQFGVSKPVWDKAIDIVYKASVRNQNASASYENFRQGFTRSNITRDDIREEGRKFYDAAHAAN